MANIEMFVVGEGVVGQPYGYLIGPGWDIYIDCINKTSVDKDSYSS